MKLVLAALALAACGDDGSVHYPDAAPAADANTLVDVAPPRETIHVPQPLQVGELVEAIMTGGPNDLALIHLSAPTLDMDWNIHAHPNGSTVTVYEEYDKMTVDYAFVPAAQAEWYLLVRNSGPVDMTVQIDVGLYGDMQWRFQ